MKDGLLVHDPMLEEVLWNLRLVEELYCAHVQEGRCTLNAAEKASVSNFAQASHKLLLFISADDVQSTYF